MLRAVEMVWQLTLLLVRAAAAITLSCVLTHRYFVFPGRLQFTHTGAQLRAGAAMYGMMLDGFFGPADWETVKATALARIARKNVALGFASAVPQHHASSVPPEEDATGDNAAAYDWEPFSCALATCSHKMRLL